ncbi:MAG: hypothetical protein HY902_00480 [Deltaproteobacteria bacterium]|nr:hypothetical protein [Deltaproteobacteria bacterium]
MRFCAVAGLFAALLAVGCSATTPGSGAKSAGDAQTASDASIAVDAQSPAEEIARTGGTAVQADADRAASDVAQADAAAPSDGSADQSAADHAAPAADAPQDDAANGAAADLSATDAAAEVVSQDAQFADTSADAPGAVGAGTPDSAAADSAGDAAADTAGGSADAAAADAGGPVLPPGAPSDTNLIVTAVGVVEGLGGTVSVMLDDNGQYSGPQTGNPSEQTAPTALASKSGNLPVTFYLHAEPGAWQVLVWVQNATGYLVAGGMTCADGAPAPVLVKAGAVTQVSVDVAAVFGPGGVSKLCGTSAKTYDAPLTQVDVVFTPPTKDGAAHFMQGLVDGTRLWVAGSQDGYVSFDFPSDPTKSQPMANWSVIGGQMCNRMVKNYDTLYCSSRNGYLHVAKLSPNGSVGALDKVWLSYNGNLGSEGMAVVDGHVYIAAHRKGIWRVDTSLGSKIVEVAPPAGADIWDLRPLDATHLAVSSSLGLHVLNLSAVGTPASPWGAFAPTPGVAGHLHVDGTRVWVGDLSGFLHLYELAALDQPQLVGSTAVASSVYGVWAQGDHAYAAAGHYLVAVDAPAAASGPLLVRAASHSPKFALDVDPLNSTTLLASEFQAVRRLHIAPDKGQDGPVLLTQQAVYAAPAALNSKILGSLRVYNAGQVAASVVKVEVEEAPGSGAQLKTGPWLVPPGKLTTIPIAMTKVKKGVVDHKITLYVDPPLAAPLTVPLVETSWLHAGDPLPQLSYNDVQGKEWNINATLAGKVGVVVIAAHSCPVGFMALATAARHLKPWIDSGQLAVVGINPWDTGAAPEVSILELPFPVLHSPLTTKDGHDWSDVLDVTLGQPIPYGPPMPIVYVVGKNGKIAMAQWGYAPLLLAKVIEEELAKP